MTFTSPGVLPASSDNRGEVVRERLSSNSGTATIAGERPHQEEYEGNDQSPLQTLHEQANAPEQGRQHEQQDHEAHRCLPSRVCKTPVPIARLGNVSIALQMPYSFRRPSVVVADRADPDDLAVDEALEPSRHPPHSIPLMSPPRAPDVDNGRTIELRH